MLNCCMLLRLDWAKPMMFLKSHVTCSCTVHAYVPPFSITLILIVFGAFLLVSLSLFLSLVALWHLNKNLLRPRILFVLGHLFLLPPLTLLHLTSSSMIIKPVRTFRRTSHDEAFIRNAKSFYRIFPILTFPLPSTVRVGSHCVASRSLVSLWSYKSFTSICTDSIF